MKKVYLSERPGGLFRIQTEGNVDLLGSYKQCAQYGILLRSKPSKPVHPDSRVPYQAGLTSSECSRSQILVRIKVPVTEILAVSLGQDYEVVQLESDRDITHTPSLQFVPGFLQIEKADVVRTQFLQG